jgi:hypothetical protein
MSRVHSSNNIFPADFEEMDDWDLTAFGWGDMP